MGHLARQLAVGLAAPPQSRVTLFSLSVALPTVTAQGVPGEYCPGPDRGWIPEGSWPHYLVGRLVALAEEVQADVIVFDGVAPYRGITLARNRLPDTAFVWFRRGMWRPGANEGQLWKSAFFDMIIEPGDLASEGDRGATAGRGDAERVPPVSLTEVVERLSRAEAASRLGIDPDRPTVLLTLGAGRLGDVVGPGRVVLETLLEANEYQICVATSAIARSSVQIGDDPRIIEIRGVFPLARYLDAFDAVVSAAGYNAVHEYIPAGLPTLLVPNVATRTDDQERRAMVLAERGVALTPSGDSPEALAASTQRLLDPQVRSALRARIDSLPSTEKTGGASATSDLLVNLARTYTPAPASALTRLLRVRADTKEALKRRLGPEAVNRVRRLLGRPPVAVTNRLRVTLGEQSQDPATRRLVIASDPDVDTLLGEGPVEHVLAGSSPSYEAARRLLVHRHYDVVKAR